MFTPPPHLSPSSINSFQTCPLKFKYSKIDGIREPPTEATLMGNFVHEILEGLYACPHEDRTLLLAREIARDLWDNKYKGECNGIVPEGKQNDFRWKSWFCVENLWGIEEPKEFEVDEIEYEVNGLLGGVQIKGFVDRFSYDENGAITVGDYKTGKVPSPKWEEDKFFQLYIYAAMLQELEVGKVDEVQLLYLKAPKLIKRKVTEEKIDEAISTVVKVKNAIDERCESEVFETKKGPLCNWCYFKRNCPAWR